MAESNQGETDPATFDNFPAAAPQVVADAVRLRPRSDANGDGQQSLNSIAFNGLLTNKILTALPGPDFAHLLSYLEPVSLIAGQDMYVFGQEIDYLYFPETAVVSQLYFLEDGSTVGAAIVGNEGMVGLSAVLDSRPASYWSQVIVSGTAVRVQPHIVCQEFAGGGAMQRLLLAYTRTRMDQLTQRAVCNGRHTLRQRLCTWLLLVHDRVSDECLSLTHENIAHHVGGRRAGISTACVTLRDLRIISYRRGRLRIANRERLEQVACECYKALQS